jgi:hypothetical protein
MKNVWPWIAGVLITVVISLCSFVFVTLANDVKRLSEKIELLDDTLKETNLLLRANGIDWPEPPREP